MSRCYKSLSAAALNHPTDHGYRIGLVSARWSPQPDGPSQGLATAPRCGGAAYAEVEHVRYVGSIGPVNFSQTGIELEHSTFPDAVRSPPTRCALRQSMFCLHHHWSPTRMLGCDAWLRCHAITRFWGCKSENSQGSGDAGSICVVQLDCRSRSLQSLLRALVRHMLTYRDGPTHPAIACRGRSHPCSRNIIGL